MHVLENIKKLLDDAGITYKLIHHEPTYTSEESAKARNEDLAIGAKAMLLKLDSEYVLFVLSAALSIDSKKIRKLVNARSTRFATKDELNELTKLVPGSVPPFGEPILPFKLYIDTSIANLDKIAFNAGSLTDSIVMKTEDYLKFSQGTLASFSSQNS